MADFINDSKKTIIVQQEIISKLLTIFQENRLKPGTYPNDIRRLLQYIQAHLFEVNLKVEEAKKACRLSNNNITTKFKLNVGLGVRQFIIYKRLKAASFVLLESNVDIYLIADAVGYSNEHFSKLFKKEYGVTPSEYRYKMTEYVKRKRQEYE